MKQTAPTYWERLEAGKPHSVRSEPPPALQPTPGTGRKRPALAERLVRSASVEAVRETLGDGNYTRKLSARR